MSLSGERIDEDLLRDLTVRRAEAGAREQLIELCRPLAERLSRRFAGRGEANEDLSQVALVGLIKAIDNFDDERGESLLPYATAVIGGELKHHFRDKASTIRVPRTVRSRSAVVYDAVERLTQKLGRSPTVREISVEAGLTKEEVVEVHMAGDRGGTTSIDAMADHRGDSIADVRDQDQQAFFEEWEAISPAISLLSDEHRRVLYLRFYHEWSQSRVAAELGVSQVQVSRILSQALGQIRASVN